MNAIVRYLHDSRNRLKLDQYGVRGDLSFIMLTPRFRASSHVVCLLFDRGSSRPALVAKVPRLAHRFDRLAEEAANLQMLQGMRAQGSASVPKLVAFEPFQDRAILVETALVGQPMDPEFVRRERSRCCQTMVDWLCEVQWPAPTVQQQAADLFQRQVETPFRSFSTRVPLTRTETTLLDQTWNLLEQLRDMSLSPVFEHGDLSHPNLFLLESGAPGIVDWETAEPYGLPLVDLYFFLTYVALSTHSTRKSDGTLAAFRSAFFGEKAWTRTYVTTYARRLNLPDRALTPLFVLCWLRYMVSLLERLDPTGDSAVPVQDSTAAWLRQNRFYTFWQEAVTRAGELDWWGDQTNAAGVPASRLMVAK